MTPVVYIPLLCDIWIGFLEGLRKILNNLSYGFVKEQGGYFIRVKIIMLHKHSDFPLTSKMVDGFGDITNNMGKDIIYINMLVKGVWEIESDFKKQG